MKIVTAALAGAPHVGDVVMLHYMAPRGGRTTAGHVVSHVDEPMGAGMFRRRPQTLEEIAEELARSGEVQYCGSKSGTPAFNVRPRGRMVRVECKDEVDDVIFAAEIRHAEGQASDGMGGMVIEPGPRLSVELAEL